MCGQTYTATKLNSVPLQTERFVGVDNFQNSYYISNNTFYKKSDSNTIEFTALNLGEITSVDLINPLKITVFYKDANTAVILDNTLAEIRRINFSDIEEFRNVSHATTAGDRRLWIYNTDTQRLEIFNYNQNKVVTEFPPTSQPIKELISNFNVSWIKTASAIDSYTIYGSFINSYPIKDEITSIMEYQDTIFAIIEEQLYYRSLGENEFLKIEIPEITLKQFSIKDEILYIYNGQNLTSFRLNKSKE
ncbi:hypothetical protein [Dokdonia sp.]|uniref:hypothetical protein n=1 Tax=Dokdonia sp. TaxID=2024995 RepID=UPI00326405D2